MQTTLLGVAIAIILALVTALVGPLFVDWGRFRDSFEARATRMTGLEVRFAGPIEVHVLPTPSVKLQGIELRRPGELTRTRARSLQIEFALDSLMRGEFRATNVTVEGPELAFGLDKSGRLDWPAPAIGFDPDAVAIDRLAIEDGHVVLSDAASGAKVTLDKVSFSGDVRSLAGPAKGDGSFAIAGQSYPYRISTGRPGSDGAVKLHLSVDPVDQPRLADLDGSVWIERGIPHVEATVQWSRGVARSAAGDPWRVTGLVRGSSVAAAVEKVEFQYGAEERAVRLRGDANLRLGEKPELSATLSAPQIDLDRVLGLPESVRRKPAVALRSLGDRFAGLQQLPIPIRLAVSAEAVTLAGGALQRLSGEVHGGAGAWTLDSLDFRAPGATQTRLRGSLNITPQGADFAGPVRIESRDQRALVSWLTGGSDAQAIAGPFRAEGDVRLGTEIVAIDRLKAEIDRMTLEGRFAYTWPNADHPARIEAALSAPEVDFDRAFGLVQDVFAGTAPGAPLEWPKEGTLALNIARSSVAGVTVQRTDIDLRFDPQALEIKRLAIADFGGASVAATGNIDINTRTPRGTVTLDLDVRALDGVTALLDKVAPQAADELRRSGARFVPAKLQGSLAVDAQAARIAGTPAGAKFKVGGSAGIFALDLQGDAGMGADALTLTDVAKLGAAKLAVAGRLEAQDGGALIALVGLDRLVAVDKGAGRLDLKANGSADGPMAVEATIAAAGLDVSATGSVRLPLGHAATAGLALKLAKADLRNAAGGTVPASLTARLDLADDAVALTELNGQVAGTDIGGRLAVGLSRPTTLDGDIRLGKANLPVLIAATVGMPGRSADGGWPTEPFAGGLFAGSTGRLVVTSADTQLTPKLASRDLHGTVLVEPSKVTLEDFQGAFAGGTIAGRLMFQRGPDGLVADGRVQLRNVDMATVSPGDGRPLSGRLTLDATIEGSGRSPIALMGSLRGNGTFTAENTAIARLDPRAFAAVVRSVDGGLPIEAKQVGDRLDRALTEGALAVPRVQGAFTVAGGAARLADILRSQGADLALSAAVDLGAQSIDATLTLTGPEGLGPPDIGRPEIVIALQGPVESPKRTLDVAAFTNWLSLRAISVNAKRLEAAEAARRPADAPARTPPAVRPEAQARLEPQIKAEPPASVAPQARVEPSAKVESPASVAPQVKVEPPAKVESPASVAPQVKVEPPAKAEPPASVAPQVRVEPPAKVESPASVAPQVRVEPPAKVESPASVAPQVRVEPPAKVEPPARIESQQQARVQPEAALPRPGEIVATADPVIQNLDKAIAANPNDAAALSERGQLYVRRGNFPFAIRDFDEALRLKPKDPTTLNNRCWALAILGDLQTALRDCNEALQIRPQYADAFDSRGLVNLKIGQFNSALADYDAALKINPRQASSLYGRGIAKRRTGNAADAARDIAAAKNLQGNIADEFATFGIR